MRRTVHLLAVAALLAGWFTPAPRAAAANPDEIADHVVGQADFGYAAAAPQAPAAPQAGCTTVVTTTVDSGYGSLRDAVACAASGDIVSFSGLPVSSTITLTSGEIAFTKTLTIDGSGAAGLVVDGNHSSRIFDIGTYSAISLTALVLQHGSTTDYGGAVYQNGGAGSSLMLNQVAVLNNHSTYAGGGISAGGPVTATNSLFQENSNSSSIGGGLYTFYTASLSGTDFISNTSYTDGGGLFAFGAVTLNGGRFQGNTSNFNGGGLRTNGTLTLTGTEFISNTGDFGGGAYALGAVVLVGGRFQGNSTIGDAGGGLWTGNTLTITGTEFISNTLTEGGSGGGAYVTGNNNATSVLTDGLFAGNICTASNCNGGGLFSPNPVSLNGTDFISNTSASSGGGAALNNNSTVTGGRFERNACTGSGCWGGGLSASDVAISGTEFISNTSYNQAGGVNALSAWVTNSLFQGNRCTYIFCQGGGLSGAVALTDTDFISNTGAASAGGADGVDVVVVGGRFQGNACTLCSGGGLNAYSVALSGTEFISNTSYDQGGGVYAGGAAVLTNGLFERNACTDAGCTGGGLYTGDTLTLSGTEFISNTSLADGGGAYAVHAGTLTGGRFEANACTVTGCSGGGLYVHGTLALSGTEFISNTGLYQGGGVLALGAATLTNGRFEGNTCAADTCLGGGLYVDGTAAMTATEFISNSSRDTGGGAYATGAVTLTNGRFERNACTDNLCLGGGLYAATTLALTGSEFISNTSVSGGGGYAALTATLTDGLFAGNTSLNYGGGLYSGDTLTVSGTEFISNTSAYLGGGAYSGGAGTLTNGRFERNGCTAGSCDGGALFANNTLTLTGTEFISNTSTDSGGGVYASGAASLLNGLFQGNTCTLTSSCDGGGLYAHSTLVLTGTEFISNTSLADGGGTYAVGAARLTNGLFQGNTCTTGGCDGGGLYASSLTLSGTEFISNTANNLGGGLFSDHGSLRISASTFSGNQASLGGGLGITSTAVLSLTNITLSGNTAATGGGGLYEGGTSWAWLLNVTVADNAAPSGGGLTAEAGATVGVTNTVLANNGASNCAGHIDQGSHNLDWPAPATCAAISPGGSFTTADPLLAPLALYAPGSLPIYALLLGSPARDHGDPATCAGPLVNNLDQRGVARPFDGDAVPGAVCDIGAFEATSFVGLTSLTATLTAGRAVSVSWQTSREASLAGFDVFRSASPNGPWTRVNGALIPVVGAPHSYSLTDTPGVGTWYYHLETVDTDALRSSTGPVSVTIYRLYLLYLPLVRR